MSPSRLEYLRHILEEANYLITQSQGLSKAQFDQDATLKRADVVTNKIPRLRKEVETILEREST